MPPILASFLTLGFIAFLFRRDVREADGVTGALWIPLLWMLIICSKATSEWLNLFGFSFGAATLEAGSPLDAFIYLTLIVIGLNILARRHVRLSEVIKDNGWIIAFLIYCFLAIAWSDYPFVAFKRWIKILGHPIMVLVVLTEPKPEEALIHLLKRCAYIIVPVSVLFIKYYPEWGRGFDKWTGAASNNGITGNKNELGHDCLILGLFFFWYLLNVWRAPKSRTRRNELILSIGFLYLIWWLLRMAQSTTSSVALLVGVLTVLFLGFRVVDKRLIGTYFVVGIITIVIAEAVFGLSDQLIRLLNKDPTLTTRTVLWNDLLKIEINPIFGAGFESFWLGDRVRAFWDKYWWHPNQAHNGYLETYLNLGLVGLGLLCGLLLATFVKIRRSLLHDFEFGRFRLGLLLAIILYNWTEASFKTISPMWFAFYLIGMDYVRTRSASEDTIVDAEAWQAEGVHAGGEAPFRPDEIATENVWH